MERVDDLPKELRDLANDYGFHVVNSFMMVGVTSARHIRHLVEIVLDEFSPTRGTKSQQGIRTQVVQHLKNPEED